MTIIFFILQQINIGHVAATLGPLFLALYVALFIDLFSKLRSNKESFNNIVNHRAIARGQYGLISKK